jgi:hypothetical protein
MRQLKSWLKKSSVQHTMPHKDKEVFNAALATSITIKQSFTDNTVMLKQLSAF